MDSRIFFSQMALVISKLNLATISIILLLSGIANSLVLNPALWRSLKNALNRLRPILVLHILWGLFSPIDLWSLHSSSATCNCFIVCAFYWWGNVCPHVLVSAAHLWLVTLICLISAKPCLHLSLLMVILTPSLIWPLSMSCLRSMPYWTYYFVPTVLPRFLRRGIQSYPWSLLTLPSSVIWKKNHAQGFKSSFDPDAYTEFCHLRSSVRL